VPQDVGQYVLYAVFVSAIKELRVNSVEDGDAHERGAEKSHLSLPIREKIDQDTPVYRGAVSKSFQDCARQAPGCPPYHRKPPCGCRRPARPVRANALLYDAEK